MKFLDLENLDFFNKIFNLNYLLNYRLKNCWVKIFFNYVILINIFKLIILW